MNVDKSSNTTQQQLENKALPMIEPTKLLIGSHGEILDMIMIPSHTQSSNQSTNITASTTTNDDIRDSSPLQFKLALITNSNQVRIMNEHFSCSILEGHKDIVLSVDVSPDG